jgi:hypothetical protein
LTDYITFREDVPLVNLGCEDTLAVEKPHKRAHKGVSLELKRGKLAVLASHQFQQQRQLQYMLPMAC